MTIDSPTSYLVCNERRALHTYVFLNKKRVHTLKNAGAVGRWWEMLQLHFWFCCIVSDYFAGEGIQYWCLFIDSSSIHLQLNVVEVEISQIGFLFVFETFNNVLSFIWHSWLWLLFFFCIIFCIIIMKNVRKSRNAYTAVGPVSWHQMGSLMLINDYFRKILHVSRTLFPSCLAKISELLLQQQKK